METKSLNENGLCFDYVYMEMRHLFTMELNCWQSKGLLGYLEAIRPELKSSAMDLLNDPKDESILNDQMKIRLIRMHLFKIMSYQYPDVAQYLALTRMRYGDKITFQDENDSSEDSHGENENK